MILKLRKMRCQLHAALTVGFLFGACFSAVVPAQQTLEQIETIEGARTQDGVAAQKQVETLANTAGEIEAEYRQAVKVVEGLNVYNDLLGKQVRSQNDEVASLTDSISKVSLIERQIVPLMVQMVDTLEAFIQLDIPFLAVERNDRVARLRNMMERSDVTAAEKFRRIIEAYDIENEYGRTIEAYEDTLEFEGAVRELSFLRIGRVALLFQSEDEAMTGHWDPAEKRWSLLPKALYEHEVTNGLGIARQQRAPDLVVVPVSSPQEIRP